MHRSQRIILSIDRHHPFKCGRRDPFGREEHDPVGISTVNGQTVHQVIVVEHRSVVCKRRRDFNLEDIQIVLVEIGLYVQTSGKLCYRLFLVDP